MRIAYLSPSGQLGGAEACLIDMLSVIRDGHPEWQLSVILGESGPLQAKVQGTGATVTVLPFPPEISRLGDSGESNRAALLFRLLRTSPAAISYRNSLRQVLQGIQPDIIHSNGLKMHGLGALAKPDSAKLVWHIHDYVSSRPAMARILRHLAKHADAVIGVSESVTQDARQTLRHPNVCSMLNVVDLDGFSPEGPRIDLDALCGMTPPRADMVRVGLVATMAWWKGHRLFLDAIAKLNPSLPFRAYVVGGSLYQTESRQESVESLRAYAQRLGIADHVGFTGFVSEPAAIIRALDIIVHASTQPEPFGRVVVEGMACGKAVISSGLGGAAEILSLDDGGLKFEAGNAESLARSIGALVQDPGRRNQLASGGLASARTHFGRKRLSQELPKIYNFFSEHYSSERLRILHLHSGNMIGGIESALQTIAQFACTCPNFEQEFALAFDSTFAERLRDSHAVVHVLPEVQLRNPLSVIRSRRSLQRLLSRRHFDAVISHSPWCQVVYAPTVRTSLAPLLFWMHGAFDGHWLQKLASRHAPDLAICNSHYTKSTLRRVYPNVRSEIIRYPVPPQKGAKKLRGDLRAELGTPAHTVAILMASRMEHWKGHFNLLHAAAELKTTEDWTIWIAGAPQTESEAIYFNSVQAEVNKLQLANRVNFVGQRTDIPDVMRAADIFCQPNAGPEPFGVVFVEALQAGVPVVTFSMGGPQEILDESCGILVNPGDTHALASALTKLIDDAGLRTRLGDAGPHRAKVLCDPATQLRRLHELVNSVINRSAPLKKGTSA